MTKIIDIFKAPFWMRLAGKILQTLWPTIRLLWAIPEKFRNYIRQKKIKKVRD